MDADFTEAANPAVSEDPQHGMAETPDVARESDTSGDARLGQTGTPARCLNSREAMCAAMREELAPLLGVAAQRGELVARLRALPGRVPVLLREEWTEAVAAIPESGALAPTCAACHATLRRRFIDTVDAPAATPRQRDCEGSAGQ